jgi:catechol 2,3-dioxygenase-like lactoylglutathione lyase family enzyme
MPSAASYRVAMSVRRIVPDFQSPEPAASREFYSEVLGLEIAMPDASVEVDDVDAAHAAVQRLGDEIVHPLTNEPWGVRRFFVRDLNGKVLNILSHA